MEIVCISASFRDPYAQDRNLRGQDGDSADEGPESKKNESQIEPEEADRVSRIELPASLEMHDFDDPEALAGGRHE